MVEKEGAKWAQVLFVGLLLLLMLAMAVSVFTGYTMYQRASVARRLAEQARAEAEAAREQSQQVKQNAKASNSLYAEENFKGNFLMHIIGATTLTEAELKVIRPGIGADAVMGPVMEAFDRDMAKVNEVVVGDEEIANYQDAVAALLEMLK